MINKLITYVKKSDYAKHVSTLVSGTVVAQGVFFLSSIVIARLYSPVELSIFATYFSVTFILSSASTLKYEHAIIIEKDDDNALILLIISQIIAAFINLLSFFFISIFASEISTWVSMEEGFADVLFFVPLGSFLLSSYTSFKNFINRNKLYKTMAFNKMIDSVSISISQILLGVIKFTYLGLVIGYIVSKLLGVLHFFKKSNHLLSLSKVNMPKAHYLLKFYRKFPKYSLPGETIGTVSGHLPVLLIGRYFGGQSLGNFSLVERVLTAPSSLIGGAVLDVFKQKASTEYLQNRQCKKLYTNTLKVLIALAVLPTLILYFFGQELFVIVFGERWLMAGEYAEIMALLFFFRFVASPLTYMFYITHKQKYDAIWQVVLFVFTILSFGYGIMIKDIKVTLVVYSVAYSILYIASTWVCYQLASGKYK